MKTQAEFFQAHAVDGVLDEKLIAEFLQLPEGDSGLGPQSGEPAPTPAPTPAPAPVEPAATPAPSPEPVILAADGVHTIGYEKLVEARNEAKAAKARADELEAENAALKNAAPPPAPTPAPTSAPAPAEVKPDFGDFSDEALSKGIEKFVQDQVSARVAAATAELEAKVAEKLTPLEKQRVEAANALHFKTIYDAHPNMDSLLESTEFKGWLEGQQSLVRSAYATALERGTALEVVEVFDSFVKATGKTAAPPPPPAPAPADPAAAARAAIAAAEAKPPTSLSEIPGSTAVHDEASAMLDMSATALLQKFAGKTPEQIEALMNKAL